MKTIRLYMLLTLLACFYGLFRFYAGQEMKFQYFKTENGMPSNMVNCVFQDSHGYMWFGTGDGLTRYDSYGFTTYQYDSNNTGSIGNNIIYAIYEDREGTLWIGTEVRLCTYDVASDSFRNLSLADNTPVLVNAITEDNSRCGSQRSGTVSFVMIRIRDVSAITAMMRPILAVWVQITHRRSLPMTSRMSGV